MQTTIQNLFCSLLLCVLTFWDVVHEEVEWPIHAQHVDLIREVLHNFALFGQLLAEHVQPRSVHIVIRSLIMERYNPIFLFKAQFRLTHHDVSNMCITG